MTRIDQTRLLPPPPPDFTTTSARVVGGEFWRCHAWEVRSGGGVSPLPGHGTTDFGGGGRRNVPGGERKIESRSGGRLRHVGRGRRWRWRVGGGSSTVGGGGGGGGARSCVLLAALAIILLFLFLLFVLLFLPDGGRSKRRSTPRQIRKRRRAGQHPGTGTRDGRFEGSPSTPSERLRRRNCNKAWRKENGPRTTPKTRTIRATSTRKRKRTTRKGDDAGRPARRRRPRPS